MKDGPTLFPLCSTPTEDGVEFSDWSSRRDGEVSRSHNFSRRRRFETVGVGFREGVGELEDGEKGSLDQ